MLNENKLIAQQVEGVAADQDLRAVGTAFAEVKDELFKAWLATASRDEAGREKLWIATTVLTNVEKVLRRRVANGRVAEQDLELIRKAGEPKKFLGIPV